MNLLQGKHSQTIVGSVKKKEIDTDASQTFP